MREKKLFQSLLLVFSFWMTPVYAACTIVDINNQDFGSVTTQENINHYYLADITVSCDSAYFLGIDAGLHLSAGSRQLAHAEGQLISYSLYKNATSTEWGSQNLIAANPYPIPALFSGGGMNSTHKIYASVSAKDKAPQGIYSDTVTLILADSTGNPIETPSILNLNLDLVAFCTLDTSNFEGFGTYPMGSANLTHVALGSIAVTCPNSIAYKIGIDKGLHLTAGKRQMANGVAFIPYTLKHNGAEWGDQGLSALATGYNETFPALAVAGVGTGNPQQFMMYGDAAIDNVTVAGIFEDTIIVTLAW
ncbi:MAG: Csu type fimbrial protein [Gammaproteobacteria bacterium]